MERKTAGLAAITGEAPGFGNQLTQINSGAGDLRVVRDGPARRAGSTMPTGDGSGQSNGSPMPSGTFLPGFDPMVDDLGSTSTK